MVAMISVICIKSGKKKLPPADVIPEVSSHTNYSRNHADINGNSHSNHSIITLVRKVTKTAIDIQQQVN
jgi:hypothetical protein